jgi:hypothetical protein
MKNCKTCGAFTTGDNEFCSPMCRQRAKAKAAALRGPTVLEIQREKQKVWQVKTDIKPRSRWSSDAVFNRSYIPPIAESPFITTPTFEESVAEPVRDEHGRPFVHPTVEAGVRTPEVELDGARLREMTFEDERHLRAYVRRDALSLAVAMTSIPTKSDFALRRAMELFRERGMEDARQLMERNLLELSALEFGPTRPMISDEDVLCAAGYSQHEIDVLHLTGVSPQTALHGREYVKQYLESRDHPFTVMTGQDALDAKPLDLDFLTELRKKKEKKMKMKILRGDGDKPPIREED